MINIRSWLYLHAVFAATSVKAPWPFQQKQKVADEEMVPKSFKILSDRPPMPGRFPSEYTEAPGGRAERTALTRLPLPHQITDQDAIAGYLFASPVSAVRSTSRASGGPQTRFPVRPVPVRAVQSAPVVPRIPQIIITKSCCRCNQKLDEPLDKFSICCPICKELRHHLCKVPHTRTDLQHSLQRLESPYRLQEYKPDETTEGTDDQIDQIIDSYKDSQLPPDGYFSSHTPREFI